MMEAWLRSEFPEVLSWRFDRNRPFDRPWRAWTRSARTMAEQGAESLSRQPRERIWGRTGRVEFVLALVDDV